MAQTQPPPQPPLRFAATADSLEAASEAVRHKIHQVTAQLVANAQAATFGNVVGLILQTENEVQLTSNVAYLYSLVAPDQALRRAAAEVAKQLWNLMADLRSNPDISHSVNIVAASQRQAQASAAAPILDGESRKALRDIQREYSRRCAASTSNDDTTTAIPERLNSIEAEFLRNLDEARDMIWCISRDHLTSIPQDLLRELEAEDTSVPGSIRLTRGDPRIGRMLGTAESPEMRKRIHLGARIVPPGNIALFDEAVQLRFKLAQARGYPSHTAYRVETMMAKTPEAVTNLLFGVRDRVLRQLPLDTAELLALKRTDKYVPQGTPDADTLLWSDVMYYTRVYEEKNYSVNHDLIAQYFPLEQTISRMLQLFGDLFGFVFVPQAGMDSGRTDCPHTDLVWHPDVKLFSVWNDEGEGGGFVGYLYLDLYHRPGKTGGAQCRPLHLGFERQQLDSQGPPRHYPSTVLITCFARGCFLQHSEFVLLFHELGHGIHDLSGHCKYSRFHGAETAGDFNEAPSQMLENWCWDASALRQLSGHHETGQPLPDNIVASLLLTRVVLPAIKLIPQLRQALFDAAVHSEAPGDHKFDSERVYAEINKEINHLGGIKDSGDRHGYTAYRHLFCGTDGTMYCYLWSKVIAMDMFYSVFKQDPLNGKAGRQYRHMVLEKGASQDELETVSQFLGRQPSSEAFYMSLGL